MSWLPAMLCLALLILPDVTTATRCFYSQLPRPTEDHADIVARLQAEGRWHPDRTPERTPPPDPQVGDTWDWYIWNLGGYPTATLKPCTVRGMGDYCYVVVDDDEWNVSMDQADVDRIVDHFNLMSVGPFPDQGIWDLNTSHFGDPPNPLDGLDRIFLLYYRFNISADGYFWIYDQYPDGTQPFASNEADVVYLATDGGNPGGNYMLGVAAHEFEHLIHFNQDANESTWVDEGLAELAMWLFGNPDTISSFNSNPDNSLTSWNGNWADYIQTYLWTLYIYEQFGGQPTIWDLVHNPTNGMSGYEQTLNSLGYNVQMEDVFSDWTVANYLDDPGLADGQYGYTGETLPAFHPFRTHSTFPASGSGSVYNWANDYIRLTSFSDVPSFDFDGQDVRDFRVRLMGVDPSLTTVVQSVPLDEFNDGDYTFWQATGYTDVVVSVANVYTISASYSYTGSDLPLSNVPSPASETVLLRSQPNPFNPITELAFELPREGTVHLAVFDLRGQQVAELLDSDLPAGPHRVTWEASHLASGQYVARLQINGRPVSQVKVALIK